MQTIAGEEFLDAGEAVALLGVKRATLYAYVSRGVLRSYRQGVGRQRLYKRSEVEGLLALKQDDVSPEQENKPTVSLPYTETWAGDH
jgi:excisionase family DNA binding protein